MKHIQKDLDEFREIPFNTIRDLVEDARDEVRIASSLYPLPCHKGINLFIYDIQ